DPAALFSLSSLPSRQVCRQLETAPWLASRSRTHRWPPYDLGARGLGRRVSGSAAADTTDQGVLARVSHSGLDHNANRPKARAVAAPLVGRGTLFPVRLEVCSATRSQLRRTIGRDNPRDGVVAELPARMPKTRRGDNSRQRQNLATVVQSLPAPW